MTTLCLFLAITLAFLVQHNYALVERDKGLNDFCTFHNGLFTQRTSPAAQAAVGDICTVTFADVYTQDEEEAKEFCDLYAPWRLVRAVANEVMTENNPNRVGTTCTVEATLMCPDSWFQINGRCYSMPKKLRRYNLANATKVCAKSYSGAKIAYMHRKYVVGVWERFFYGVEQVWVEASETWEKYVIPVEGDSAGDGLALAFTGQHYNFAVPNHALTRVDPNVHLHVLCEYTPPMTTAEVNYIGRRYSEIYWPSVSVNNGILIRSGTHYVGTDAKSNLNMCKNILKPFLTRDFEQFIPTPDYMQELTDHKPSVSFSHTGGYNYDHWGQKNQVGCIANTDTYRIRRKNGLADFPIPFGNKNYCDILKTVAINHVSSQAQLQVMSDARTAPLWCKLGTIRHYKPNVPAGYAEFKRPKSGEVWAHKLIKEMKTFDEAEAYCEEKEDAHLTGFDTVEEGEFVRELAKTAQTTRGIFIGGRRRTMCESVELEEDVSDPCSQQNIFQWQNNVASEPMVSAMWTVHTGPEQIPNPNYASLSQKCLTIIGLYPGWVNTTFGGYLDDVGCHARTYFICGKMVEMVEVP